MRATEGASRPIDRTHVVGWILVAPVWLGTLGLVVIAGARMFAFDDSELFLLVNSYTLWIYLPAYAVAAAAICFRNYGLAAAALLLVVVHIVLALGPAFRSVTASDSARRGPHLRVVSANLRYNNAEANRTALLDELDAYDADVLVLQEVTPDWWRRIVASDLLDGTRDHVERLRTDAGGLAIISRHSLTDVVVHDVADWPMITATLTVEGRPVHLGAVHVAAPIGTFDLNQQQQRATTAIVRSLARPRVVAGDFNASPYNRWYQEQLDLGLDEAHEVVGRPFATTWPNGLHHVPPLRLDHVFTDPSIVPFEVSEGQGRGSDHRPIVVDLAVG